MSNAQVIKKKSGYGPAQGSGVVEFAISARTEQPIKYFSHTQLLWV